MADFVQKTVNKTAVRDLAVPIATVTSFNNLIQAVIADNPFGCVGYTGSDGVPVDPVVRNREHYTAKVNFVNDGKKVGTVSLQSPSITAFEAGQERRRVTPTRCEHSGTETTSGQSIVWWGVACGAGPGTAWHGMAERFLGVALSVVRGGPPVGVRWPRVVVGAGGGVVRPGGDTRVRVLGWGVGVRG